MTVSATNPYVAYAGADTSGPFAIPFRFLADADLVVSKISAAGAETALTGNTITGADDDDGGELYTAAPVAAGETLRIYRDTTRTQTAQYVANGPFPAATHERALDKQMLVDQEQDRDLGRSLLAPLGETLAGLPGAAARASKVLAFDSDGDPVVVEPVSAGAAAAFDLSNVDPAQGRSALGLGNILEGAINVLDYGGTDTAAIEAAWDVAQAERRALYFPGATGRTYTYDGDGLTGPAPAIIGDGPSRSVIVIAAGKHLIDDDTLWENLLVEKIRTVGGKGALRHRRTLAMVSGKMTVRNCEFRDYTGCAISFNSVDAPNLEILDNLFVGLDYVTTMGVASKGLSDNCRIQGNEFQRNRLDLKMSEGGNNAYVVYNAFLKLGPAAPASTGTNRCFIHIVPDVDGTNAGTGLYIGVNKLGNEGMDPTDKPIFYGEELAGTWFGDKFPDLTSASTGYIRGHRVDGIAFFGNGGAPNVPLVYSATPNVLGCAYEDISIGGTPPTYILQFRDAPTPLANDAVGWNLVGPISFDAAGSLGGSLPSNAPTVVRTFDPMGVYGQPRQRYSEQGQALAVGASSTTYIGPSSSGASATGPQWRFASDKRIRMLKVFTLGGAVPVGGSVTVTAKINAANLAPSVTVTIAAGQFGASAVCDSLIAADLLFNVQIVTNASAGTNDYLVVMEMEDA